MEAGHERDHSHAAQRHQDAPAHIQREIGGLLAEIQGIFKPGAKVLLVVDNGSPDLSAVMGVADFSTAIDTPPTPIPRQQ